MTLLNGLSRWILYWFYTCLLPEMYLFHFHLPTDVTIDNNLIQSWILSGCNALLGLCTFAFWVLYSRTGNVLEKLSSVFVFNFTWFPSPKLQTCGFFIVASVICKLIYISSRCCDCVNALRVNRFKGKWHCCKCTSWLHGRGVMSAVGVTTLQIKKS